MRRGTTPVITLTVGQYDISDATHIWVTFEQDSSGTEITRKWERFPDEEEENPNDGISVDGQTVTVKLSQEETLEFAAGSVTVQVKVKIDDFDDTTTRDTVVGTEMKKLKVEEILNEDVM